MNALRSLAKLWTADKEVELISLTSGEFYIVRPNTSLKGTRECIFDDALIAIRRTASEYNYELVAEKVFREDEAAALNTDEADETLLEGTEKSFLIDEALQFRVGELDENVTLSWRDMGGDPGDRYEYVIDGKTVQRALSFSFVSTLLQCAYERKYQKSSDEASEKELEALLYKPQSKAQSKTPQAKPPAKNVNADRRDASSSKPVVPLNRPLPRRSSTSTTSSDHQIPQPSSPLPEDKPRTLAEAHGELHMYELASGSFLLQEKNAIAQLLEIEPFSYWLVLHGPEKPWTTQPLESRMNATFNTEHKSFIWNYYDESNNAYSWLLRFPDTKSKELWQQEFGQFMWEALNKMSWSKANEADREYTLLQYNDVEMGDAGDGGVSDEEGSSAFEDADEGQSADESEEEEGDRLVGDMQKMGVEEHKPGEPRYQNSQLAVGYKHDRSFVVRGNKIGVYSHTDDDQLQYSTTIDKIADKKGRNFTPTKVMLHQGDTSMVLQNPNNPNALFRMDLEVGKVVDEWRVNDNINIKNISPDSKYAQMTQTQTLVGVSHNALFRIDPRLSGDKLVDSQYKQYATKNAFSNVSTTGAGGAAVASDKGDLRLYDSIGKNAKVLLPALGDPFIGLDTTADGHWVVGTCRSYLLLLRTEILEGRYAGLTGFDRSFAKDMKPLPIKLQLKNEHVSFMNCDLAFTPARFNTSPDGTSRKGEEKAIVTSVGPFVITWDFEQVKKGRLNAYTIRKFHDDIVADNFKFGADSSIIIALPDDVMMTAKKALLKPTRQSLQTPTKLLRSRHKTVNSPY